jgi:hypothetical protein
MQNDQGTPATLAVPPDTPAPPPPMPTAKAVITGAQASTLPAPADSGTTGIWEVDPEHLGEFVEAIHRVRDRLREVAHQVDLMRSDAYTPKLGTSPVSVQLEQKFTDRLDTPVDNPEHPTSGGLRPMLAESMRRMEDFLDGAEAAVRTYQELDQTTQAVFGHHGG